MSQYRTLYLSAAAAVLVGAAGFSFAVTDTAVTGENDALAVAKAPVSLVQAVTAAEQSLGGKASRAEYERDDKHQGYHYEVEVVNGARVYDVRVDAASGKVTSSVEDRADKGGDKDDND